MSVLSFSDIASAAATIIALLALGVSLYELMDNRPKLRIAGDPAILGDALQNKVFLVTVTNFGRQPTTISGVTFVPKRSASIGPRVGQLFLVPLWELSTKLPHVLDVGRTLTIAYSLDAIVKHQGADLPLRDLIIANSFRVAVKSAWHSKHQLGRVRPGELANWTP